MAVHEWVLAALWLFVPAYFANMAPIFAMAVFPKWKAPIDGGRTWKDGRPILGSGKTWRGLIAGGLFGAAFAAFQTVPVIRFQPYFSDFARSEAGWTGPVVLGLFLGVGAIVGDAVKSFFKRRTGRKSGASWFPFDQLDFVVGGLLFGFLGALILQGAGLTAGNWWVAAFAHWQILAVLLVLTPALHFLTNVIGYKLKLKDVPW